MTNRFNPKTIDEVRKMINTTEPLPGMFDLVVKLTHQAFRLEEHMCRRFCARAGIEIPKELDGASGIELGRKLAKQFLVARQLGMGAVPLGAIGENEEQITQCSWVVDIRKGGEPDYTRTLPRVEVVRKGMTFFARMMDLDGRGGEIEYRLNDEGELQK